MRSQETNSNSNNNHPLSEDYHNLEQLIEQKYPEPQFDFGMPRNFTIRAGQTAMIKCRVDQLGDKSVSFLARILFYFAGGRCLLGFGILCSQ